MKMKKILIFIIFLLQKPDENDILYLCNEYLRLQLNNFYKIYTYSSYNFHLSHMLYFE